MEDNLRNVESNKARLLKIVEQNRLRLENLRDNYDLTKYEIKIIRLNNRLDRLIYIYDRFSYEEIKDMQKEILNFKKNVKTLADELNKDSSVQPDNPKLVELNELLKSINKNAQSTYDALAELRVRVINDNTENLALENKQMLLLLPMNAREDFERTNVHVEKFTKDFNDLEYEYNKLKM